jgi:glycosyltransferase involved in cell wall biosynthesis
MKILYLCYWGIEDGLTQSTVFPNLEILSDMPNVTSIVFCTIERESKEVKYSGPQNKKITFSPLYSKKYILNSISKISDFILLPLQIKKMCQKNKVDKVITRGAMISALTLRAVKDMKIPMVVESFEPHADYMLESGVWKKWDIRYFFQKKWEQKVKLYAEKIVTVSYNYKNKLISEGVNASKIDVVPCCVNNESFMLNISTRMNLRRSLCIDDNDKVGIYVGKFGDIYYDSEAFKIFKTTFDVFNSDMFLIILTPNEQTDVMKKLEAVSFPLNKVYVSKVPHSEVAAYLSSADFAFTTIKPAPSRQYCSAVKNGEYWASGLPILMTEGVGDDTQIIETEGGGAIFNLEKNNLEASILKLKHMLESNSRIELYQKISPLAIKHRNFSLAIEVYKKILEA